MQKGKSSSAHVPESPMETVGWGCSQKSSASASASCLEPSNETDVDLHPNPLYFLGPMGSQSPCGGRVAPSPTLDRGEDVVCILLGFPCWTQKKWRCQSQLTKTRGPTIHFTCVNQKSPRGRVFIGGRDVSLARSEKNRGELFCC